MKCISVTFGLRQAFDGFCFKSPRFVWNLGNQDFRFCERYAIHGQSILGEDFYRWYVLRYWQDIKCFILRLYTYVYHAMSGGIVQ